MNNRSGSSAEPREHDRRLEADIERSLGEYVREEPLTSLAIAGAAGFILGGGAKSRIGLAALAMVGKTALRGAATNLIVGLFFPETKRSTRKRGKSRPRDRDERHDHARHDNGRADFRNPG